MPEPINRTILLLDIEGFGKHDDVQQTFMRRVLYDVVRATLEAAGVEPTAQRLEDRGDSVIALVHPEVPKVRLLKALLTETPALLHGYNRVAASSTQVRLRIVLASGEVALHEMPGALGGLVGTDLNQACRLLDSQLLRDALRTATAESVLCLSESAYRGTAGYGWPGIRPEEFRRVVVQGKEGPITAWLHGAGGATGAAPPPPSSASASSSASADGRESAEQHDRASGPGTGTGTGPGTGTGREEAEDRPAANVIFMGGTPRFNGGLVTGSQTVFSGGRVTGDVFGGGKQVWNGPDRPAKDAEHEQEAEDGDDSR